MLNNKKLFIFGMMLGTVFSSCLGNTKAVPFTSLALKVAATLGNDDRPLTPFLLPPCSKQGGRRTPELDGQGTPRALPPCSKEDGRGTPKLDGRGTPVKILPPCS